MTNQIENIKKLYSVLSICMMACGAALIFQHTLRAGIFWKLSGVILVLFGIIKLFGYFSKDFFQLAFQFDFAMGIVSCLLGLVSIGLQDRLQTVLTVGLSLFLLLDALLKIQTAIDARKFGLEKWWIILVMSLIVGTIGVLIFLRPYAAGLENLIGFNIIIDGILNLYVVQSTVKTFRRKKEWEI